MKITRTQERMAFTRFVDRTAVEYAAGDGEAIDRKAREIRAENARRTAAAL